MDDIYCKSWAEFEDRLKGYIHLDRDLRDQFIFRGHSNIEWSLESTLDRRWNTKSASDRIRMVEQLISEFQQQSLGLNAPLGFPNTPRQWELLGRHHGLPSAILDWTTSPFVAAFFAFSDDEVESAESAAIWTFDRRYFSDTELQKRTVNRGEDAIELWDDIDDFRFNPRAIEQGSVFMKVHYDALPLNETCGSHILRFLIPSSERQYILTKLHEMRINHRNLFRDLDYAGKTASWCFAQDNEEEEKIQ